MDLIYQNPYRILGLPVTATDREIAKRIGDMSIYAEMGKSIEYNSDNYFPVSPIRTTESIEEAKQKIDQPDNKLFYALFWFWENSNNTVDEMAFEELKNGNIAKTIEFWERETDKGISLQNMSNFKNISVLYFGLPLRNIDLTYINGKLIKENLLNNISFFGKFISNGYIEKFSNEVLGYQHTVDIKEIIHHFVDEIITMIKPHIGIQKSLSKISYEELLTNFKTFPESIQNFVQGKFTDKHIHNIKQEIDKTAEFIVNNERIANKAGFELYKNTKDNLYQLQIVYSTSDLKYQLIADKLADKLVGCSIAYFNEFHNTDTDPGEDALELLKLSKNIAVGDKMQDRIKDNFPIIKKYVEQKPIRVIINPLIKSLNQVKNKVKNVSFNEKYNITKDFIFRIKVYLDKLRKILKKDSNTNSYEYIENILSGCAIFVDGIAIDIANKNSEYGRSIELIDMASRILLYESNAGNIYSVNKELSNKLTNGRKVVGKNITTSSGLIVRLFGGGVRMAKKRITCGCGSGKNLKECCSV